MPNFGCMRLSQVRKYEIVWHLAGACIGQRHSCIGLYCFIKLDKGFPNSREGCPSMPNICFLLGVAWHNYYTLSDARKCSQEVKFQ